MAYPSEPHKAPSLVGEAFRSELEEIVKKAVREAMGQNGHGVEKPTETPKIYLTIKDAADISRLASSTIRLYIRRRELKAHQVGSRVIIKRADLERFLEAHPIEVIDN